MESSEQKQMEVVKDWQLCFTGNLLRQAETYVKKGQVTDFSCGKWDAKATVDTKQSQWVVQIGEVSDSFEAEWNPAAFHCPCQSKYKKPMPYRNQTKYYSVCAHEAAVLLYWEQRRGSRKFQETQERMVERLERIRLEEERRRERQRREAERRRQQEQAQKDRQTQVSVSNFRPVRRCKIIVGLFTVLKSEKFLRIKR